MWWCLLELLHKHGVGDSLRYAFADVAKACQTSTHVLTRVLAEMGKPWPPLYVDSTSKVPPEFQLSSNSVRTQLKLTWMLVGTELQLTIPKVRERWANRKSKTISKPSQDHSKTSIEVEVYKKKKISAADPRVATLIDYFSEACQTRKAFKPKIAGQKDGPAVKRFLASDSEDDARALIDWYLGSKKCEEHGPNVAVCFSAATINLWRARQANRQETIVT